MFYMPCAKVNICKKSLRAGSELGGALSNLPCHGLAPSLAAEGTSRLCLHQVALFGACGFQVECFDSHARNKCEMCCAVTDEPKQWHYDRSIYPCRWDTTLPKDGVLPHALSKLLEMIYWWKDGVNLHSGFCLIFTTREKNVLYLNGLICS